MQTANSVLYVSVVLTVLLLSLIACLAYERLSRRRRTALIPEPPTDSIGRRIDIEHDDGSIAFSIERASRPRATASTWHWTPIRNPGSRSLSKT
jgi:hypothetical protein